MANYLQVLMMAQYDIGIGNRALNSIYSVNHLHRIGQLILKPVSDSNDLTVDAQVQALVLPGAPTGDALKTDPSERLAKSDLSGYTETIVARNMFAPANVPPRKRSIPSW